jgi:cell division protein FtsB
MRHSKAEVAAGTVRTSVRGLRRTIVVVAVILIAIWTSYAFAQEAYLGHKLSQQVADLHRQNARLAAVNSGYRKDVQSITSGTADEEEARINGYARSRERLYLVTAPPSPTPVSPAATPGP